MGIKFIYLEFIELQSTTHYVLRSIPIYPVKLRPLGCYRQNDIKLPRQNSPISPGLLGQRDDQGRHDEGKLVEEGVAREKQLGKQRGLIPIANPKINMSR